MKPLRTLLFTIAVFFFFGPFAHAQNTSITRNKDGSIDKEIVIKEFNSLLDTLTQYPQKDEESNDLIKNYLSGLFPYPENVKIRDREYDGLNQDKAYTLEEQDQINKNCYDELANILYQKRLSQQETIGEIDDNSSNYLDKWKWLLIILICCLAVLIVILIIVISQSKSKKAKRVPQNIVVNPTTTNENDTGIIVRRKTTSVMRKQSLNDAIGNDNYMIIDCQEFCNDSSVRRMYIKNSCIKDIYNMYAEDLRNPNNPKEDGCMVLGRWVHDDKSDSYDVSLEEIVLPGDDAIFSEYELNFGGKIKLRVSEKLKKLRRDTELQYDLTCWVHSHPGLGVFFSNSDCNVQTQLKHPTHPNFLTAIVIDILTPQQELGIFTYKHDSSIISKAELKKLYSLEDWYKWALESERHAFKHEDHYNTLANASTRLSYCHSIELNNSVIIDICMLTDYPEGETLRMIHGFINNSSDMTEYVAVKMSDNVSLSDNEFIGAFIVESHCSIPSVRKALTNYLGQIKFVLVYSTTDGILTSIPITNNDLCIDQTCYGTQKLEDLKIWTRRKR